MKYLIPIALFFLTGCYEEAKEHEIHCGEIVDKHIIQRSDRISYECNGDGKVTQIRTVSTPKHQICVYDGVLPVGEWFKVDKETYDSLNEGDVVTRTKTGWKKAVVIEKTRLR